MDFAKPLGTDRRTDGPTDGQSLLMRCEDASKKGNEVPDSIVSTVLNFFHSLLVFLAINFWNVAQRIKYLRSYHKNRISLIVERKKKIRKWSQSSIPENL